MSFIGVIGSIASGIAGAAGTVAGAIAAPVASGLGALGVSTAAGTGAAGAAAAGSAAAGSMAATIGGAVGAGAVGAAGGAGLGALTSAAMGKDPGEGAAWGALGGAVTGGASSVLGGSGGAGVTTASEAITNPTAATAAPGVTTVGDVATDVAMNQVGNAVNPGLGAIPSAAPVTTGTPGFLGGVGDVASDIASSGVGQELGKEVAMEGLKAGYGELQTQGYNDEVDELNRRHALGYADGGLATLKGGGSIKMVDGQYVIPADVVSALGNGSSKAGAEFLREAFSQIRTQGGRKPGKAPKKAGALAHKRMMERRSKNKAA